MWPFFYSGPSPAPGSVVNFPQRGALLLRGELANGRQVDALFPPIAEAKVAEDEPQAA